LDHWWICRIAGSALDLAELNLLELDLLNFSSAVGHLLN
jgi:hypothetical protein